MARGVRHRADEGITYAGLDVHAPPGVHDDAFALVARHLRRGADVVDLGAGSGAFAKRLADGGFRVEAVEGAADGWTLPAVPVRVADLNTTPWDLPAARYDAAVAIEVLEHVENPSAFVREVARIVRPGGLFFFTTPNVCSVASRRLMLTRGELAFFRPGGVFDGGHLTILPYWLLEDLLEKEGLLVEERAFLGRQKVFARPGRAGWKHLVVPVVDGALLALGRGIPRAAAFASSLGFAVRIPAS